MAVPAREEIENLKFAVLTPEQQEQIIALGKIIADTIQKSITAAIPAMGKAFDSFREAYRADGAPYGDTQDGMMKWLEVQMALDSAYWKMQRLRSGFNPANIGKSRWVRPSGWRPKLQKWHAVDWNEWDNREQSIVESKCGNDIFDRDEDIFDVQTLLGALKIEEVCKSCLKLQED